MWRVLTRMAEAAPTRRDRHAARGHQAGRGPHYLRARRCRGVADPGLIAHFRHEIEQRIDEYSHKADIDDAGILDPTHMVAAE